MVRPGILIGMAAVLALGPGAPVRAQEKGDWMPPEAEEIAVRQFTGLLGEAEGKAPDAGPLTERARAAVRRQRARLESWGEKGLLQQTPDLAKLEMPTSGDAVLDAMARYQMCNAILYMRHLDRARETDPAARLAATEGVNAVTLAVLYLGRPFLVSGKQAQVEGFLTSPEMEAILGRIQDQAELREYTAGQCRPMVSALVAD
jgi:hypothetical protein